MIGHTRVSFAIVDFMLTFRTMFKMIKIFLLFFCHELFSENLKFTETEQVLGGDCLNFIINNNSHIK